MPLKTVPKGRVVFASEMPRPGAPEVVEISAEELAHKLGDVHIIDVRGSDEFEGELGRVTGAVLMELPELPKRLKELPSDETIVFVCRSGARSTRATELALASGIEHVYNMKGGMLRWRELGLPIENS